MVRRAALERSARSPNVVQLARQLIAGDKARPSPTPSTSKVTLDSSPSAVSNVKWVATPHGGKSELKKLPKPAPIQPRHFYRFRPAMGLPEPPRRIEPQTGARSRYEEHARRVVAQDMLYLTYDHHLARNPAPEPQREPRNPLSPYTIGKTDYIESPLKPKARAVTPEEPIELESIHLAFIHPPAYSNKTKLLPIVGAMRALAGIGAREPGEPHRNVGLRILKTKIADRKRGMRTGVPVGVNVRLSGERMYAFLETLVEVVMPRWRTFKGVSLPHRWTDEEDVHGSVVTTLPKEAVPLFPQLEVNSDRYPTFEDLKIGFTTTARGAGAQARAIALLSGFRLPFVPPYTAANEAAFAAPAAATAAPKKKASQKGKQQQSKGGKKK